MVALIKDPVSRNECGVFISKDLTNRKQ